METIIFRIDSFLISFFRLSDIPILGYYLGSTVLSIFCVVLGQATIAVAFLWNRRFIEQDNRSMVAMHNSSLKALAAKDKSSYKKCNRAANEAFGKVFFSQIALAASSLWPLPFAVGWMQTRFFNVNFPLPVALPYIGSDVGYLFTFLPIYILMFILFGKIKRRLPFFRNIAALLDGYGKDGQEQMISITELVSVPPTDGQGNRI
jgi:hypothetical protein